MQRDLVEAEVCSGLLDLSALADKRDCACTKLWWVGAWHVGEPFMEAIDELPRVETKL